MLYIPICKHGPCCDYVVVVCLNKSLLLLFNHKQPTFLHMLLTIANFIAIFTVYILQLYGPVAVCMHNNYAASEYESKLADA